MRNFVLIILTVVAMISFTPSQSVMAQNQFDQMEAYREIQKLLLIKGNKRPALDLAKQLLAKLKKSDAIYMDLSVLLNYLGNGNPHFPMAEAIAFATGEKEEIYCRNVGLVHLTASHNDGTTSTLDLIESKRQMNNSYSHITSGTWTYVLDTEYREPEFSQSKLVTSTKHSYTMQETRERKNSVPDNGVWNYNWGKDDFGGNFSTTGATPEPLPMQMANDYHLWGSVDLGFSIVFKLGAKGKTFGHETGAAKTINLLTDRTVTEKIASYPKHPGAKKTPVDSLSHYSDCFKVHSTIKQKL